MKTNSDGYFRKNWGKESEMFHRFIYRAHHGDIPEGYDVHHKCSNRACSNIAHLECIECSEHKIMTNTERYRARKEAAKAFWSSTGCTGAVLSRAFDVSESSTCSWIKEWRH